MSIVMDNRLAHVSLVVSSRSDESAGSMEESTDLQRFRLLVKALVSVPGAQKLVTLITKAFIADLLFLTTYGW